MKVFSIGYNVYPSQELAHTVIMEKISYSRKFTMGLSGHAWATPYFQVSEILYKTKKEKKGIRHILYYYSAYRENDKPSITSFSYLEQEL